MKTNYHKKKVDGRTVWYQDIGTGTPLFCFPGWTLSSNSYLPLSEHLDQNKVRLILPDIPGWAGKTKQLSGTTSLSKIAKLMTLFIQSFDLNEYSLLGYSYGGIVVQQIVKSKDLPVSHVFLISTFFEGGNTLKERFTKPIEMYKHAKEHNLSDVVIRERIASLFKTSVIKRNYPKHVVSNPYAKEIIRAYFSGNVRAMIESGLSILKHSYLSENLKSKQVVVMYADKDMNFISRASQELSSELGVEPIIVKGDHNHMLFYPQRVATELNKYF